jgi:hypothetical protein
MQNNWTIDASFCASVEQTVVFQDKRSRTAFCSTFFRKKVEEERINLNLSLILNVSTFDQVHDPDRPPVLTKASVASGQKGQKNFMLFDIYKF